MKILSGISEKEKKEKSYVNIFINLFTLLVEMSFVKENHRLEL